MEEIKGMHSLEIEWGCITNLMDRISLLEEEIDGGWMELIEMIADAVTMESTNQDPSSVFFSLYQFMWRLYYRVKANPTKRPFNQISKTTILEKEVYRVTNYNYEHFKWAMKLGVSGTVTNDYIDIPATKLTDKQRRAFDRRIGD